MSDKDRAIQNIKDNHRLYCLTCPARCEDLERQIKAVEDETL